MTTDLAGITRWLNEHPQPAPAWDERTEEQTAALGEGRVVVIGGRPRQLDRHGEWGRP